MPSATTSASVGGTYVRRRGSRNLRAAALSVLDDKTNYTGGLPGEGRSAFVELAGYEKGWEEGLERWTTMRGGRAKTAGNGVVLAGARRRGWESSGRDVLPSDPQGAA